MAEPASATEPQLMAPDGPPLVLASGSATRAGLLRQAGLVFVQDPAHVDEDSVKDALRAEGADAGQLADTLAELKAARVSARYPGTLVLGADQVLILGDTWFDKPADRAGAREQLIALRDASHRLVSAAVIMRDGTRLWGHRDHATLRLRPFSDAFLDAYLDAAGGRVQDSVGGYQLEGLGVQLFSDIQGDFFTVLGLPLLPLLDFLRVQGALLR